LDVPYELVPVVVDGVCSSALAAVPPRPTAPSALLIILWLFDVPITSDVVEPRPGPVVEVIGAVPTLLSWVRGTLSTLGSMLEVAYGFDVSS